MKHVRAEDTFQRSSKRTATNERGKLSQDNKPISWKLARGSDVVWFVVVMKDVTHISPIP
jgi:hypothetical protein